MKKSVFISRNLPETSQLLTYLLQNDWEVHYQSLIQIEPIPFQIEGEFDWIFISSSNGAKILLESFTPDDSTKFGVVGTATANAVKEYGIYPDFVGQTGNMNELADQLSRAVGNQRILFVGAKGGSEKIRSKIAKDQRWFIPIYQTVLKEVESIPDTNYIFLTSPSNAKSYLKTNSLNGRIVIAIGNTTAEYLNSCGVENMLVPLSPRENDVIALFSGLG